MAIVVPTLHSFLYLTLYLNSKNKQPGVPSDIGWAVGSPTTYANQTPVPLTRISGVLGGRMVIEKPCLGRCKSEREQGRMWLRLNREQTADLKAGPFEDPYLATEVKRAIVEGKHYWDQTMVFFVPPDVARAILRWSE